MRTIAGTFRVAIVVRKPLDGSDLAGILDQIRQGRASSILPRDIENLRDQSDHVCAERLTRRWRETVSYDRSPPLREEMSREQAFARLGDAIRDLSPDEIEELWMWSGRILILVCSQRTVVSWDELNRLFNFDMTPPASPPDYDNDPATYRNGL